MSIVASTKWRGADAAHPDILDAEDARRGEHALRDELGHALRRAVDQRVDGVDDEPQRQHGDQRRDRDAPPRRRPTSKPSAISAKPASTASEEKTSEAKCSESASSAALRVCRPTRRSARARQALTTISTSSTATATRLSGGGAASASDAGDRLHRHAAGEQQQQRRLAERREVLELAVPVGMRRVGRPVADADRHPSDAGGEEIDAGMQRVGDQRQAADRQADHELRRREDEARDERNGGGAFLERHGMQIVPVVEVAEGFGQRHDRFANKAVLEHDFMQS